jgi:hypothetical protein
VFSDSEGDFPRILHKLTNRTRLKVAVFQADTFPQYHSSVNMFFPTTSDDLACSGLIVSGAHSLFDLLMTLWTTFVTAAECTVEGFHCPPDSFFRN